MAGDVVWLDVLPSMDKFKQQLEAETETASTAAGKDAGTAFSQAFEAASSTSIAQQQAADLEKAAAATKRTVTSLTQQIAQARAQEREATAKVVLAEQALADARTKFGHDSAQTAAAELKLEAARERVSAASTKTTSVEDQLKAAQREHREVTEQLTDATRRLGAEVDQLPGSLGGADTSLSRLKAEAAVTGERLDVMRDQFDEADTRAMGFRDGITGVTDSVAGLKLLMSGEGSLADSLFLLGAGFGDLASSGANLVVPMIKQMITRFGALKLAMLGVGAVAAIGIPLALLAMQNSADDTGDRVDKITDALYTLVDTGRLTGELARMFNHSGLAVEGVSGEMDKFRAHAERVAAAEAGLVDRTYEASVETSKLSSAVAVSREKFAELDGPLADYIRNSADSALTAAKLEESIGKQNLVLFEQYGVMPQVIEAINDARQEAAAYGRVVDLATERLKAFKDQLLAQTNPIFGWISAQQTAQQAQKTLTETIKEHGPTSREAEAAQLALAEAQLRATAASSELSAVNEAKLLPTLDQLVTDGLLSADAADALAKKLKEGKVQVDKLDGSRARVDLQFRTNLKAALENAFSYVGGLLANLPGFADGGTVPGPTGAPRIIEAHGGEIVLSLQQVAQMREFGQVPPSVTGGPPRPATGTTYNFNGDIMLRMEDVREVKDLADFVNLLRNNSRRGLVTA